MQNPKCSPPDPTPNPNPTPATLDLPGLGPFSVLYQDDQILALDKPAGIPSAPNPTSTASTTPRATRPALTLETALSTATPSSLPHQALHHLDPEANGAILFARSPIAAAALRSRFSRPHVSFRYLAVVGEKPRHRRWSCCLKLSPDPALPGRFVSDTRHGLFAATDFEVLAHGDGLALLLATASTDRPHQIRVHLTAAGLPILGDPLYGFGRDLPAAGQRAHLVARTKPRRPNPNSTSPTRGDLPLALRLVQVSCNGLTPNTVLDVRAPFDDFLAPFGFAVDDGQDNEPTDD